MTTTSKPQWPGVISLDSTGMEILSPPPNATNIVIAGDPVQFKLPLSVSGWLGILLLYANEPVQITHHITAVETNTVKSLGPFAFMTPAAPGLGSFEFTTGPFTTGLNGSGAVFTTAGGDDDAVYRVITELHFTHAVPNSVIDDQILTVVS
jgi:hypothetical protein